MVADQDNGVDGCLHRRLRRPDGGSRRRRCADPVADPAPARGAVDELPRGQAPVRRLDRSRSARPELATALRERFLDGRRTDVGVLIAAGIDNGELPDDLDTDAVIDLSYGALYEPRPRGRRVLGVELRPTGRMRDQVHPVAASSSRAETASTRPRMPP
ncbi:TetR-like C-terminal domain-containing protein [Nocardia arthritidis]|uniref:TetR-like C-terminal domain-containing protein n=1 Tax=Nocardia arthritidis TaxID=228602 RepID=UPI000A057769